MNKKLITIILATTLASVSVGAITSMRTTAGDTFQRNHAAVAVKRNNWMNLLDSNLRLSEITIPGSNDAMSYGTNLDNWQRTQVKDIRRQLESGIRAFDLGVQVNARTYEMHYHNGQTRVGGAITEPFQAAVNHLKLYPSETIYLNITQEGSKLSDREFGAAFVNIFNDYKNYIYLGRSGNPTLAETRGKIVLISDNSYLRDHYGAMDIRTFEGVFEETSVGQKAHLYAKWESVKEVLEHTDNLPESNTKIYINNIGGYGQYAQPWFVASGQVNFNHNSKFMGTGYNAQRNPNRYPDFPRMNNEIYYEGLNPSVTDYLTEEKIKYAGIVFTDFAGDDLIDAIIKTNHR